MSETRPVEPITVEQTDQVLIVHVNVKLLDEASAGALQRAIDEPDTGASPPLVVIDLSRVQYLPSLCLGALVAISSQCKARHRTLKLAAPTPQIRKVLAVTYLDREFELTDSVEAAVQSH